MSHRYQVLADRIKQELISLEKVVNRSQRGMAQVNQNTENQDLLLDSYAICLNTSRRKNLF